MRISFPLFTEQRVQGKIRIGSSRVCENAINVQETRGNNGVNIYPRSVYCVCMCVYYGARVSVQGWR